MTREHLDARGLLCPLPVIRVQARVRLLQPGDILEVRCTDPGALIDIPAWCRLWGHRLISAGTEDHEQRLVLEVGAGTARRIEEP